MGMTDKSSFIGGARIYLVSNILISIIPFILLPILTRYLSPAEYGKVAMFQTSIGALGAFVGIVFLGAANRKYYDKSLDKNDLADFIGSCVQLMLFCSLVTFLIVSTFKNELSEWLSLEPYYVVFAVLVASAGALINLRLGQWQVQNKAIKFGALQISQSILNMFLSLLFVFWDCA